MEEQSLQNIIEDRVDNSNYYHEKRNEDPLNPVGRSSFTKIAFSVLRYLFISILVVHLFGLFGVFISLAYPIIWFFLPSRTWCFYCLHQNIRNRNNGYCKACNRTVTTIYSPPFRSMLLNMITMLIMSFIFFLIILGEVYLLSNIVNIQLFQRNETEFVIPDSTTFRMGTDFYFDVELKNISQPINLVKAELQFPTELIEVKEISVENGFATIFTKKDFSNQDGLISIIGGLPNPGFIGTKGSFARVTFTPKKTGVGEIKFLNSSKVLANDGHGTNILYRFANTPIAIIP